MSDYFGFSCLCLPALDLISHWRICPQFGEPVPAGLWVEERHMACPRVGIEWKALEASPEGHFWGLWRAGLKGGGREVMAMCRMPLREGW